MPDLRLHLLDGWSPNGALRLNNPRESAADDWEPKVLSEASLWWVSEQMVDVLVAAMADVPGDITPEELSYPDEAPGLVVFQKPLHGIDRSGRAVLVDAIVWGGSIRPVLRPGQSETALAVSSYIRINPEMEPSRRLEEPRTFWLYFGQTTWPLGDMLSTTLYDGQSEDEAVSNFEDRRLLAALWTFLTQPGVADIEAMRPDRGAARRQARAGLGREDPSIQIVRLRRITRDPTKAAATSDREYSHQWIVSGHWRRQRVGVQRAETRLVWISPYVKGPPDKPLVTPQIVRAWVR